MRIHSSAEHEVAICSAESLGLSVDKKSREQEILHEDGHVRLSAVVDFDPLAHMPKDQNNGLVAVFEDWLWELMLEIHFKSSVFSKEAIFNVGNTCCRVFRGFLLNPSQVIGGIQSLSDHDLDQILAWNSGDRLSVESTIYEEISRHVKHRSDAPALHAWDGNLTYHQLDLVFGNLQAYLRDLGIRVGELVPVYFEKSQWAVVAMLSILKAGSKYHCQSFNAR